jgi:hypothetical protein
MQNFIFQLANSIVVPAWLLMIAAPRWHWTHRITQSHVIPLFVALLYAVVLVPIIPQALPMVANPKLEVLMPALNNPSGFTALWVHVLTFDLFVGSWIYLDSRQRNYNPWLMAPILIVTLLFGPLGFAVYKILTWARP